MTKVVLKYIGNGSFAAGFPARDLTDEDLEGKSIQEALDTGLYIDTTQTAGKPKPSSNKLANHSSEDKEN